MYTMVETPCTRRPRVSVFDRGDILQGVFDGTIRVEDAGHELGLGLDFRRWAELNKLAAQGTAYRRSKGWE